MIKAQETQQGSSLCKSKITNHKPTLKLILMKTDNRNPHVKCYHAKNKLDVQCQKTTEGDKFLHALTTVG
jgi:hypothetical protein